MLPGDCMAATHRDTDVSYALVWVTTLTVEYSWFGTPLAPAVRLVGEEPSGFSGTVSVSSRGVAAHVEKIRSFSLG